MHVVFVIARRGLSPVDVALLRAESAREGDIMLIDGCDEGVNSKSFMHFTTAWELFGATAYRFFIKVDTDSFVLPRHYAAMLRALPTDEVNVYGGLEFARGRFPWVVAPMASYMSGGGYFLSPNLAASIAQNCRHCTDAPVGYEDSAIGFYLDSIPDISIFRVRLNMYQSIRHMPDRPGTSDDRFIKCILKELEGAEDGLSAACHVPHMLLFHGLKSDEWWYALANHYRRNLTFSEEDGAFFRAFVPPAPDDIPANLYLEAEPFWFP